MALHASQLYCHLSNNLSKIVSNLDKALHTHDGCYFQSYLYMFALTLHTLIIRNRRIYRFGTILWTHFEYLHLWSILIHDEDHLKTGLCSNLHWPRSISHLHLVCFFDNFLRKYHLLRISKFLAHASASLQISLNIYLHYYLYTLQNLLLFHCSTNQYTNPLLNFSTFRFHFSFPLPTDRHKFIRWANRKCLFLL